MKVEVHQLSFALPPEPGLRKYPKTWGALIPPSELTRPLQDAVCYTVSYTIPGSAPGARHWSEKSSPVV